MSDPLRGKVLLPDTIAYDRRIDSIWSLDAALEPWCVVMPESTNDTVRLAKIISENQCPFGIRSGGHAVFANSNSIEDGVTVDFGYLNGTTYEEETNTASIEAGGRWGAVYKTLESYGVGAAGGGQTTVGVAGFLLGGGMSFFNNAYGFGCDTIKNMEVVLANGTVVNANANENRELWIALKGGSGNFGFVTRFDLEAIPFADRQTPRMWGGTMIWNISVINQVLDTMVDFTKNLTDLGSSSHVIAAYSSSAGWAIIGALENKDNVDSAAFDGYKAIPKRLSSSMRSDTLFNIAQEFSGAGRSYNIWIPGAVKNDKDIQRYIFKRFDMMVKEVQQLIQPNATWSAFLQLQPITLPMIAAGKGTNAIGLDAEVAAGRGPGIMTSIGFAMETVKQEALIYPLALSCQRDIDKYAETRDAKWLWRYLNYADLTYDAIGSYGIRSVKQMQAVSSRYDPVGVFQKLRRSGFKIPW
ncbi:FAD-dependent monooxygenase CTB5 [Paramyrothecium foliicola]|nr:FAD-dependent monooxygenase CTB5 [Paramyrothecium foliicola]